MPTIYDPKLHRIVEFVFPPPKHSLTQSDNDSKLCWDPYSLYRYSRWSCSSTLMAWLDRQASASVSALVQMLSNSSPSRLSALSNSVFASGTQLSTNPLKSQNQRKSSGNKDPDCSEVNTPVRKHPPYGSQRFRPLHSRTFPNPVG